MISELVVNTDLQSGKCCSKFITTDKKTYKQEDYKSNEIGVLANLLISEGKPSKVFFQTFRKIEIFKVLLFKKLGFGN